MFFFRGDKQKREGKPYLREGGSERKRKMGKGIARGSMGSRQLCSFVSRRARQSGSSFERDPAEMLCWISQRRQENFGIPSARTVLVLPDPPILY